MIRILSVGLLTAAGFALAASQAEAQVFVRAPFVRVQVGGPASMCGRRSSTSMCLRTEPYYVAPVGSTRRHLPSPFKSCPPP